MIGKVMIGKSFRGCLLYCLQDKQLSDAQAIVKGRAEILLYNQCFGTAKELIRQFNEVRLLNQKVEKPVLHITLSLAPGEQLGKDKLTAMIEACVKDLGFGANQYIAVVHKDTGHQHLHLVANRIGLNGRTVPDSNSYKKMALFCRKMEQEYGLRQVQSPRRYLSTEERQSPRLDNRKERLKADIKQSLATSGSYTEFAVRMKALGYGVIRGRGISFLDSKGVNTKGSAVGYSLTHIEHILEQKQAVQHVSTYNGERFRSEGKRTNGEHGNIRLEKKSGAAQEQNSNRILKGLLSAEQKTEAIAPQLLKKKPKRQNRPQH
jgi:hypothetical protein